jgi:hypothetical protein
VTGKFVISALVILLVVSLTDVAHVALATDGVQPSPKPETWIDRAAGPRRGRLRGAHAGGGPFFSLGPNDIVKSFLNAHALRGSALAKGAQAVERHGGGLVTDEDREVDR